MKVRLSVKIAFVFIFALIIHEDQAGVVLKRFKPRRAIKADSENDAPEKKMSSIGNSTVTVKLLNSSIVYLNVSNNFSKNLKNNLLSNTSSNISETVMLRKISDRPLKDVEASDVKFPGDSIMKNTTAMQQKQNGNSSLPTPVNNSFPLDKQEGFQKPKEHSLQLYLNHSLPLSTQEDSENQTDSLQVDLNNSLPLETQHFQNLKNQSQQIDLNSSLPLETQKDSQNPTEHSQQNHFSSALEPLEDGQNRSELYPQIYLNNSLPFEPQDDSQNPKEHILLEEQNKTEAGENQKAESRNQPEQLNHIDKNIHLSNVSTTNIGVEIKVDSSFSSGVNDTELVHGMDSFQQENYTIVVESSDVNEDLLNQTGSIVLAGLDYLANSEVAKNVATAMEIFNLSDTSLTDHIIDDSVIDLVLPSHILEQDENSKKPFSSNKSFVELVNKLDNSSNADELTRDALPIVSLNNVKKCPAPGICVFWFMAQNTCTSDDQCLGSKMCCRIRCSKQCIDV